MGKDRKDKRTGAALSLYPVRLTGLPGLILAVLFLAGCGRASSRELTEAAGQRAQTEADIPGEKAQTAAQMLTETTEPITDAAKAITEKEGAATEAAEKIARQTAGQEKELPGSGHIVAIDPGHQGSWVDMSAQEPNAPGGTQMKAKCSTGTVGTFTNVPEYQLNLDISLQLRAQLEERGYQVILTREDNDTAISNAERALLAAREGAEIYLRIHANGSDDPSVSGALGMIMSAQNPYVGELYPQSYALARSVMEEYCKQTGFADRGIEQYDTMTGINWSRIPVMILEMGFMSNQSDDEAMQRPEMQKRMVTGIADGIDRYFKDSSASGIDQSLSGIDQPEKESEKETEDGEEMEGESALTGPAALLYEQYIAAREMLGEKWSFAISLPSKDGKEYHAQSWRGKSPMQSASVIKLFIMGTVYDRICYPKEESSRIAFEESYEGQLRSLLEDMIASSSNEAANALIDVLGNGDTKKGMDAVNAFCEEQGYQATHLGRKFMETDPEDDNYTSAEDTAALLSDLLLGRLVNEEASKKMLSILKMQTVRGKIPAGLPSGYTSANKTGEMPEGYGLGCIENDAAIIWPPSSDPYILTVFSNELKGNNAQAAELIRDISAFTAEHAAAGDF